MFYELLDDMVKQTFEMTYLIIDTRWKPHRQLVLDEIRQLL